MKEASKYLKEKYEDIHIEYPNTKIKYQYQEKEDIHLIESILYSMDVNHPFYDKELFIIFNFFKKYPDENIIFYSDEDESNPWKFNKEDEILLNLNNINYMKSLFVGEMLNEITDEQKEFTKNFAQKRMEKSHQQILLNSTYGTSGDLSYMDSPEYKELYNRYYENK